MKLKSTKHKYNKYHKYRTLILNNLKIMRLKYQKAKTFIKTNNAKYKNLLKLFNNLQRPFKKWMIN
jgi:hypothetical protein